MDRGLERCNCAVGFGPTIAEELPGVADLADHVEVHVGDHNVVVGALLACGDELAAGIYEIALAVELADAPGLFPAWSIDGTDEVLVCYRVCRLLKLPEIFAQAGYGC